MVDWAAVCKPKEFGGLGILNTKSMNIALMLKWIWRFYQNDDDLWADLIHAKYLGERDVFARRSRRKALNFGRPSKRSSGYSKWEPSIRFIMENGPFSG
jgi:hypothetical protein